MEIGKKEGVVEGGGGGSSKSRMVAGGSQGERARLWLAGCSVEIERK